MVRRPSGARNRADQLVYQVEKTLAENAAKLPEAEQAPVRDAVAAVKRALETGDADAIARASADLEKASHRMAEGIYRGAGATPGPESGPAAGAGGAGSPGGDVIDAEVVDDRKQG